MVTAIIFIIVLSVLVFVHELGHFIFAKLSGMRVDEFGIGFPPRLFTWGKGETKYSINWLPFGGFVKIYGEDQSQAMTGKDSHRSFGARPRYLQALTLIAGVSFNVLFAWLLYTGGLMYGLPVSADFNSEYKLQDAKVIVTSLVTDAPAAKAGLMPGDEIKTLSGNGASIHPESVSDIQNFVKANGFAPIVVDFVRVKAASTTTITPVAGIVENVPAIGVGLDAVGLLRLPIHLAIYDGAYLTISMVKGTITGLGSFVYRAFTEEGSLSQISGPVGIAGLVGDARQLGIPYMIAFISFISINLAVINLIPFPALDGGRLLMVGIEAIIRRPIPVRFSNILNTGGFILLLLLMALVTYQDIAKLLVG